jgi:hypothetical protein
MTTLLIDIALVRRRQIDLGVSDNDIAKCFGRGHNTLRPFWDGRNHRFVHLQALFTLAQAVGVDPRDLLMQYRAPEGQGNGPRLLAEQSAPSTPSVQADMAALCAFLVRSRVLNLVDGVCEALDWDRERFEATIERLAADLPRLGLTVHRINGQVGVVAADIGHPVVPIAGVRLGSNVTGLKEVAARELIRILEGQKYSRNIAKGPRGVSVSHLRTAGLVEGWPPQPTADCLRGMLMDLVDGVPPPTVPYRPSNPRGRLGDRPPSKLAVEREAERDRQRVGRDALRQWARNNGYTISNKGRIPRPVQAAYDNRTD